MENVAREKILEALQSVMDPDLGRSIVDLGFVQNLRVCGGNVAFDIELTTPACPVREQLQQQAEDAVLAINGVEQVSVTMTAQTRRPTTVQNLIPGVKNAIAVAAGKGGVGKSTTSVNLAIALAQSGASVGLMDADIYGPSIPIMLGVPEGEQPDGEEFADGTQRIYPIERHGIKLISVGFLTEKGNPIIWRGPMIGKMIQTFLGSVVWGELDYLIIDLPPGTGDTQLSLIQNAPLSGAVIVTTPENVALEDVIRAGRMFEKMAAVGTPVPILGIVENMSWFETPGGEQHIWAFIQDITERKRTEQMKNEFVSAVSHELRTPLTSISGSLGLLVSGMLGELPGPMSNMLGIAHKNAQRLTILINDLLDMEKLLAGKMVFDMQVQPLLPIVAQSLEDNKAYADTFGVRLSLLTRDEGVVNIDAQRLQQVLANFISNAVKFSPLNGEVEIHVVRHSEHIEIAVVDHGSGISEEFRERIFQKFAQADSSDSRQRGGTGLGLAISKAFVERMYGSIGFVSEPGRGATFFACFPLVDRDVFPS